jgi:hypothetical protein
MADVFISYSSSDEQLASFMHKHLTDEGVSVFLASLSMAPGQQWSPEVLNALNAAPWVLFLASRAACASAYVQQEVGVAVAGKKQLIPVVWDLPPSQLPGWTSQYQALNLAGKTTAQVQADITAIAGQVKAKNTTGLLIAGLLLAGLVAFGQKG